MAKDKELTNGEVKTRLTNGCSNSVPLDYQHGHGKGEGHMDDNKRSRCCRYDFLRKISNGLVGGLENTFYRFVECFIFHEFYSFLFISYKYSTPTQTYRYKLPVT